MWAVAWDDQRMSTPTRTPGRPTDGGPVVAVRIRDRVAAWCDGQFSGDPDLIAEARHAATISKEVALSIDGPTVTASLDTPLGVVAALMSGDPHRAVIEQAPDEVLDQIPVLDAPYAGEDDPED